MKAGAFSMQVTNWGQRMATAIENKRRGITIKLFNAVILDTPVDTGRARANWLVQIGEPDRKERDRADKSGGVAIAEVTATVASSVGDTPVTLTNNLVYIDALEKGHSKQAPAGMVRKNVARFARLVRVFVSRK